MPLVSSVLGHWPDGIVDLAGYGRQARQQIRDWARFGRTGRLRPENDGFDYEAGLTRLELPILSIVMAGDEDCPSASAEALLALVPAARSTLEFEPDGLGHNRWARRPEATVERVESWLATLGGRGG